MNKVISHQCSSYLAGFTVGIKSFKSPTVASIYQKIFMNIGKEVIMICKIYIMIPGASFINMVEL